MAKLLAGSRIYGNLTVDTHLSASGVVYTSGGNSNDWNNVYSNVSSNSAKYESTYTTFNGNSSFYVLDGGNTISQNLSSYVIDFGTLGNRFSVGTADPNGNWWNYISGITDNIRLKRSDNLNTTIGLAMSAWGGGGTALYNDEPPYTPSPTLNSGTFAFSGVTSDAAFFTSTDNPKIVLTGLDASASYDLILYGSRNTVGSLTTDRRHTTYYIGNTASKYSVDLQTSGPPLPKPVGGDYWNSSNVVMLSNVTPDSNNNIVLSLIAYVSAGQAGARTFGYINALQIISRYIPSLLIGTNNRGNVAFETNTIKRITIDETGKIGINTNPSEEQITIQGSVSSNNVFYALNGNSNVWNSTYSTVNANSSNWNYVNVLSTDATFLSISADNFDIYLNKILNVRSGANLRINFESSLPAGFSMSVLNESTYNVTLTSSVDNVYKSFGTILSGSNGAKNLYSSATVYKFGSNIFAIGSLV